MCRIPKFPKTEQKKLSQLFPDIERVICAQDSDAYKFMAVSAYDSWLGEDDEMKLLSNMSLEEQRLRDKKFDVFSKKIIENTDVINLTLQGTSPKPRPVFRKFLSKTAKLQHMRNASNQLTSCNFFQVALPELEALYLESWGDTNIFYLRNEKSANIIESWANESGLYRLDYR